MSKLINLDVTWKKYLLNEFSKDYMVKLKKKLLLEKINKVIYPKGSDIFSALNLTPLNKVKVVIVGQDPYSGKDQAHGLSFSVLPKIRIPPTLKNIFKELHNDLGIFPSKCGFLKKWAEQGILLLNSVLTVQHGIPNSHVNMGWEIFTHKIIEVVNLNCNNIIFVLWGRYAQNKLSYIDKNKHFVILSSHPSLHSADKGFFGSKPFSKINMYLKKNGYKCIDWKL